jgi:hypothetical protein
LAARAIEAEIDASIQRVARLTVDLFRPAGMLAIQVETQTIRAGRRIEVIDALVSAGGHLVARVTGLVLALGTEPPGKIWRPEPTSWPSPLDATPETSSDGWQFLPVTGGFDTGERTRVWTNETRRLVEGEELSPLVRAAVSGDLACPLANASKDGLHYINADYTLTLGRQPVGPWIGLEVAQQIQSDGISLGSATLVDTNGPFAMSTGSSITTQPLRPQAPN